MPVNTSRPSAVRRLRAITLAMLFVCTSVLVSHGVATGGEESGFPLPITKFNCEEDPGVIGQAEVPEGCELVEGVSVSVTDSEGTAQGSCVTDENGTCTVEVFLLDDLIAVVEEDESTGTEGYSPRENPVEVLVNNEFAEAKIVNIRDTEELPDTGSGTDLSGASATLAATLLTLASVFAFAALTIRRARS